jgi:hypothetical protein
MNEKMEKVNSDIYAWISEKEDVFRYDEAISSNEVVNHPEWITPKMKLIGTGYVCGYDIYGELWIGQVPTHFYQWI